MSVRILYDPSEDAACMYCSTSGFAFGPLFYEKDGHEPRERIEAFLRWCGRACPFKHALFGRYADPRGAKDDAELESIINHWRLQEPAQYAEEEAAERKAANDEAREIERDQRMLDSGRLP